MIAPDQFWTVEEACQNACPAARQVLLDGWLLRAAGGRTRRTNSVNPLRGGPQDPSAIVARAEALFFGLGQPAIFRVPAPVAGMDAPLDRLGYALEGETLTLLAELGSAPAIAAPSVAPDAAGGGSVALAGRPDRGWHAAWSRLRGASQADRRAFRAMVDSLVLPAVFAAFRDQGRVLAFAFGVVDRDLLVVEAVGTDPGHRGRGLGRQVVGCLMGWAHGRGARHACLQVAADNAPALALYRRLGFLRELYRYHYRCKSVASAARAAS